MHRLIGTFVVRIWHETGFLHEMGEQNLFISSRSHDQYGPYMNPMNIKLSKSVQVLFRFVRKNHIFYFKVTSSNLRHQWSGFKQLMVERFAE